MPRPSSRHGSPDRTSRLIGFVAVAIVLVGCTTAGAPNAAGSVSPSGAVSASPSDAASAAPSDAASPAPSDPVDASPAATAGSVDVDLATLLPSEIAGKPVTIELGTSTSSFMNLWKEPADAVAFLAGLGKSEGDVSLVFGYNSDDFPNVIHMTGFRVAGADGQTLAQGIADQLASRLGPWTVTTETLAGRTVVKLAPDDASTGFVAHYFVVIRDTVVDVEGNPPEWVEEAVSKLP
jgi:hypothetical protein